MNFKLPHQILTPEIHTIISREIRVQQLKILRATKKILKEIAEVSKEIEKRTFPDHLICKKLPNNLGSGIFLHPEAKPILKGSVIASYAGEVSIVPQNDSDDDGDYVFAPLADIHLTKEEQSYFDKKNRYHPRRLYSIKLDALNQGNFTRFINHSEKPNIVAELFSITSNPYRVPPSPMEVIYMAKQTIHPGEQLLISYEGEDKSYWGASKIKPFPMTPKTFQLNASLQIKSKNLS